MAFELPEIRSAVKAAIQDDGQFITGDELEEFINSGLRQVNNDRPLRKPVDITGDGTQDYALPSDFEKTFSDVFSVETPTDETPPRLRPRDDDWFIYEDPSKAPGSQLRLRFRESTPTASETIRVTLTTTHTVTETTSTLDQTSFLAVVYKTLQIASNALSMKFSQGIDPTIDADVVDRAGVSSNFLFSAERFQRFYDRLIGLARDVKAAQALGEHDVRFLHNEDLVFHLARFR